MRRPRSRSAQSPDDAFRAALGELREASFADKEAIVEQLVASGHASARAVLTRFLEDRLFVRTADQSVFIVKSADETLPAARRSSIRVTLQRRRHRRRATS